MKATTLLLKNEMIMLIDWGDELLTYPDGVTDLNKITKNAGGDYDHIVDFGFQRSFFQRKRDRVYLTATAAKALMNDDADHDSLIERFNWRQFLADEN